jgi:hypothetical protein
MRGQVQRRKKSILGKKQPYCAIICANCQKPIGWEDPTQALINFEHTADRSRRNEERKQCDEDYNRRMAAKRAFVEDEPTGEDPSCEEQILEIAQEKGIPTMVGTRVRAAALNSASMAGPATGSTSAPSTMVCSSTATRFVAHPQGCMCDWCIRMRIRSTF